MSRKIIAFVITLAMILLLAGCNLDKKIGESITEGILEKASDEDIDIDLDGEDFSITTEDGEMNFDEDGGYTFEGEDGEVVTVSSDNEWPEGMAADLLPKLNKGTITYTMNLGNGCMVSIEEIEEDEYTAYLEKVKDAGFTEDEYETKSDDILAYSAYSDEKTYLSIYYTPSEKTLSITLTIEEESQD